MWAARLYNFFPHDLINGKLFGGKKLLNKICVFRISLQLLPETFLINSLNAELNPTCHLLPLLGAHHILHVSRIRVKEEISEIWWNIYIGLHVKYLLFLSDFNEPWIFRIGVRNIFTYQILWKCVQWEPSCCARTDRRREQTNTDMAKSVVYFRSFANAPKTCEFPQSEKPVIPWTSRNRSRFYGCSYGIG